MNRFQAEGTLGDDMVKMSIRKEPIEPPYWFESLNCGGSLPETLKKEEKYDVCWSSFRNIVIVSCFCLIIWLFDLPRVSASLTWQHVTL